MKDAMGVRVIGSSGSFRPVAFEVENKEVQVELERSQSNSSKESATAVSEDEVTISFNEAYAPVPVQVPLPAAVAPVASITTSQLQSRSNKKGSNDDTSYSIGGRYQLQGDRCILSDLLAGEEEKVGEFDFKLNENDTESGVQSRFVSNLEAETEASRAEAWSETGAGVRSEAAAAAAVVVECDNGDEAANASMALTNIVGERVLSDGEEEEEQGQGQEQALEGEESPQLVEADSNLSLVSLVAMEGGTTDEKAADELDRLEVVEAAEAKAAVTVALGD
jgi:hypothetical protein